MRNDKLHLGDNMNEKMIYGFLRRSEQMKAT